MNPTEAFAPHCPEAERGVLGCCLLDTAKTTVAVKAGVTTRWFYDARHIEIFKVLSAMADNGGGDSLVAILKLRQANVLDRVGGLPYINELQDVVPSAENLEFYIPELRASFHRRSVLEVGTRLRMLAGDGSIDPGDLFTEAGDVLRHYQTEGDALPDIVRAKEFLASDIPVPPEVVFGLLHQGNKLIVGGSSKSYKTWALLDLAVSVATGTPWLGFQTTAGKVLYVNLEIQPAFFHRRLREVAHAKQLELNDQPQIWNLRGYPTDYRVLIPKIRTRIRDEGFSTVIIDPTYKLLGVADENSATDITALLNALENLALTTGAAVVLAGHFAKGNAASKESIDRISGSGVFARDPDSLVTFTKHEQEGAFSVEMTLRNLPPVNPFVVRWDWPVFRRDDSLDPTRLKQMGGRPVQYGPETLLEALGQQRLTSGEWEELCDCEYGVSHGKFYDLLKVLRKDKKVSKSPIDEKWEQIRPKSRNSNDD